MARTWQGHVLCVHAPDAVVVRRPWRPIISMAWRSASALERAPRSRRGPTGRLVWSSGIAQRPPTPGAMQAHTNRAARVPGFRRTSQQTAHLAADEPKRGPRRELSTTSRMLLVTCDSAHHLLPLASVLGGVHPLSASSRHNLNGASPWNENLSKTFGRTLLRSSSSQGEPLEGRTRGSALLVDAEPLRPYLTEFCIVYGRPTFSACPPMLSRYRGASRAAGRICCIGPLRLR